MRKLLLLLTAATALCAQNRNPPGAPAVAPGEDWVALFNGKDLSGWTEIGKEKWAVENGIIRGIAVTKEYGYLKTEKNYKDFHLAMKFKCNGDGNSGVFFHSEFKAGTPDITQGLQFEIDCSLGKHTGGIYGDGRQWIVWPAPENEIVVRRGEWNEYLLTVIGNRYIARLNGVQMIDFTDPRPRSFDGGISLQLHSGGKGDMEFKDLYIRDLSKR